MRVILGVLSENQLKRKYTSSNQSRRHKAHRRNLKEKKDKISFEGTTRVFYFVYDFSNNNLRSE